MSNPIPSSSSTESSSSSASGIPSSSSLLFTPKGYQGFGSFHSDNVEELIRIPTDQYIPPVLPVDCTDLLTIPVQSGSLDTVPISLLSSSSSSSSIPLFFFGKSLQSHFYLDPSWTFINHGAFGGACKVAMKASQRWAEYAETQPLRFIDRELFPLMCYSLRRIAAWLNVSPTAVALIPNATYGLTSIIESFSLTAEDSVYMLDIGYGSVKKMLTTACEKSKATLHIGTITFPVTRTSLVQQVVTQVPTNCKLAVIDHITSNTGILMPIHEIILALRQRVPSCRILIDGAHGLATLELNLDPSLETTPDYFISNCHKWLCSTKGLGLMVTRTSELARTVRAAVISHGYGSGYTSEFLWDGCRDYSMAVALPTLLDYWTTCIPITLARTYCQNLLKEAVTFLTTTWKTETHVPIDCYSHMACVQLPYYCLPPGAVTMNEKFPEDTQPIVEYRCTSTHGKMLQDALHYGFRIECPIKTLPGPTGTPRSYIRISAMVYNSMDDYRTLNNSVQRMRWNTENGSLIILENQ